MRAAASALKRHWFLAGLLLAVVLAWLLPRPAAAVRGAVPFLVAAVMAIAGFTMRPRRLLAQLRDPRGLVLALAAVYGAAPLVGALVGRAFAPSGAPGRFTEAVALLSAQAGTISSAIALTIAANGNRELALLNTLASNLAAPLLTPLALRWTVGVEVAFEAGEMMRSLAATVVAPVGAGILLRAALARLGGYQPGEETLKAARAAAQCIILFFAFVGFARAAPGLSGQPALVARFAGAALALHAGLLALLWGSYRLLDLEAADRAAVLFTGSQKTLPSGMLLAERFFAGNPYAAVPLVLHHLLQLVVDSVVAARLPSRAGR